MKPDLRVELAQYFQPPIRSHIRGNALLNCGKSKVILTPKVFGEDSIVFPVGITLMSACAVIVSVGGCIFASSSFVLI